MLIAEADIVPMRVLGIAPLLAVLGGVFVFMFESDRIVLIVIFAVAVSVEIDLDDEKRDGIVAVNYSADALFGLRFCRAGKAEEGERQHECESKRKNSFEFFHGLPLSRNYFFVYMFPIIFSFLQ